MKTIFNSLSPSERKIITICVIGMLLALAILGAGDRFLWNRQDGSKGQAIGMITSVKNDTRLKNFDAFAWLKIKNHEDVHVGDSVYAGDNSFVRVKMKQDYEVIVGENSLVRFTELDHQQVPDLTLGRFRLRGNGRIKVAINGKMTDFNGKNTDLELDLQDGKKPKIRMIAGSVKVSVDGRTQVFSSDNAANSIELNLAQTQAPGDAPVAKLAASVRPIDLEPLPAPAPTPVAEKTTSQPPLLDSVASIIYDWKLYDLYQSKGEQLIELPFPPSSVTQGYRIHWSSGAASNALIQIDKNPDFQTAEVLHPNAEIGAIEDANELMTSKSFVGANYFRVSADKGEHWSPYKTFNLTAQFLSQNAPTAAIPQFQVALTSESTSFELDLKNNMDNFIGYVAQASGNKNFTPQESRFFWEPNHRPRISLFRPGTYYYRFRAVNTKQELSTWSAPVQIQVFVPSKPAAPKLSMFAPRPHHTGMKIKFNISTPEARSFLEVYDQNGLKLEVIQGNQMTWLPEQAGSYFFKAFAINRFGQMSEGSDSKSLNIPADRHLAALEKQQPEAKYPTAPALKPDTARTDSVSVIQAPFEVEADTLNTNYNSTQVSVQTYYWTLQSSQQWLQQSQASANFGIGIDLMKWGDRIGYEGLLKSGVVNLVARAQQTAMNSIEARMHYRFITAFPFGLNRELQTSLFGGFEYYTNTGGIQYLTQYQMLKFGTAVAFPVMKRWSTGGELVYGLAADSSTIQEISGYLKFYPDKIWSVSFGYRLNYLQAGSANNVPLGLIPYREGYTEGYSSLDYHF